jgi:choice-of-anchor B domain-containing protein
MRSFEFQAIVLRIVGFILWSHLACFSGLLCAQSNLNMSLVSQVKPSANPIAYGDVWAEDKLACLGVWTGYNTYNYGVGIYSISNPAAPVLLSIYTASSVSQNQFELGVVRNRIGYFGSWSSGGLHIVSLTNPVAPLLLSRVGATTGNVTNGFDRIHTLFLERDFLYQAAHVAGSVTVKVFNVTNPAAPIFLRDIYTTNTTKVHQMTVRQKGAQTLLFTSGWGGNDNSNPASPGQSDIWDVTQIGTQPAQWLGRIYSGYNSHSSWPTDDGNTLIVCRELTGGDVKLYDVSNPASIPSNAVPLVTLTPASMGIEADIPHNPVVVSNILFLSWYQNGIQVFDITDRTNPVRIGYFDTFPGVKTASYQGNWGVYPWLGFHKILLSDIQSGLFVINGLALLTPTNNYPPLMVRPPASLTVTQGFPATFTPSITGSLLKHQWRFNGAPIADATNAALSLSNVQSSQAGNYSVTSTNSSGAVTSAVATLSVVIPNGAPIIASQPQDVSVYADNSAAFSVGVVGASPFTFQWRFNGAHIANATNQTLLIDPAQSGNVGYYSVIVSNSFGAVTSSNALLSLLDSPYLANVTANPGSRGALIHWNTTLPSDSTVEFELATSVIPSPNATSASGGFGSRSYLDSRTVTNHVVMISGLQPGTRYSYQVISVSVTNAYLSGVYQFVTAGTNIVDNPAATFSGAWTTATSSTDKYLTNYAFATSVTAPATASATFTPNLSSPGLYDVAIWYPQGGNRANNAPYTINSSSGSATITVNQQSGGGTWQAIGSAIEFPAGNSGNVVLANSANPSVVLADAVRFAYRESQDFPATPGIPIWWSRFFFGTNANPLGNPDNDEFTNWEEYLAGTLPTDNESRLKFSAQTDASAARITFWPYLADRSYKLLVRTNVSDPVWQTYSPGSIQSSPFGHGIFTVPLTNAPRSFYRLQIQWSPGQSVSGESQALSARSVSAEADPACGPYRVFVRPADSPFTARDDR